MEGNISDPAQVYSQHSIETFHTQTCNGVQRLSQKTMQARGGFFLALLNVVCPGDTAHAKERRAKVRSTISPHSTIPVG